MKRLIFPTLLLLAVAGCKTKGLEYLSFDHFKVAKLGFPNSTLSIDVTAYNPNKFGLKLTELESDVFLNQEYLGKAIIDSAIDVPRQDTFLIPVKMDVKMSGTVSSLLQLMNSKADSTILLIKLAGKAKLRKAGVVINYPINYEDNKVIKF